MLVSFLHWGVIPEVYFINIGEPHYNKAFDFREQEVENTHTEDKWKCPIEE